jgi:hypothetical protein
MEGQQHGQQAPPATMLRAAAYSRRHWRFQLAALTLAIVSLCATGFLMLNWLQPPEGQGKNPATGGSAPGPRLFHTWPRDRRPDLVVVLSGEDHGYIQPCGCSKPQYGGLERRYNFLKGLTRERGWPIVAVDVGDIAQRSGPQALVKYRYTMEAMKRMSYTAVGIGLNEMSLPLIDALGEFSLNNPSPRVVVANLEKAKDNFPGMVEPYEVAARSGAPRIGAIGVVGPSVAHGVNDPVVKFADVQKTLRDALPKLREHQCEILVLLYQGSVEEAKRCAKSFPEFQIIQCLTREEEPPSQPERVGDTLVIGVGHKGRHLGLVGIYRSGRPDKPFDLHYWLAELGPEYETPEGKDADNPILGLFEDYAKEVKSRNYLAHYAKIQHPIQQQFKDAKYVGSEKCKKCHEESYRVWKASPHSHAYATLQQAKRPSLRQYDGECVVCHVTGFGYESGFTNEKERPELIDNGCENCHGPASLHVKDNYNEKLNALMNPYKTQPNETEDQRRVRMNQLDASCQKCHDIDNDVHWKIAKWTEGKIVHKEPK